MGHERLGVLPATGRWRKIVANIAGSEVSPSFVAIVAEDTLLAVKSRLHQVERDDGVRAAFGFLVGLALAGRGSNVSTPNPYINLDENPSTIELARRLRDYVATRPGSPEYRDLAQAAGIEAISEWVTDSDRQAELFRRSQSSRAVWKRAGEGAGFCELARKFFARFTERYLNYFLDRTASSALSDVASRESFGKRLRGHVDVVSHHAFDTALITQSFAAGWFNRYAPEGTIADEDIGRFLHVAFAKIREELFRQARTR